MKYKYAPTMQARMKQEAMAIVLVVAGKIMIGKNHAREIGLGRNMRAGAVGHLNPRILGNIAIEDGVQDETAGTGMIGTMRGRGREIIKAMIGVTDQ